MHARRMVGAIGATLALGLAGCGGGAAGTTTRATGCASRHIVVTTSILGDVVSQTVGESASVEVLMPIGADPHSYQASAAQVASLREADLVVVNGLGLEEGLNDVIAAAETDGVGVVEAASFITPRPLAEAAVGEATGAGTADEGDQHEPGALDPHIWTDPQRMADVVAGLGDSLAALDPACAASWRAGAAAYRRELLDLDGEIAGILAGIPAERRKLVTNHEALGYFAERYGFEVVGVIIPGGTTFAESSPAGIAALVEALRTAGVRAIFAETTQTTSLAEAVASELGEDVAVVSLYTGSLGEPGSGAETYIDMQRLNAERIARALQGS